MSIKAASGLGIIVTAGVVVALGCSSQGPVESVASRSDMLQTGGGATGQPGCTIVVTAVGQTEVCDTPTNVPAPIAGGGGDSGICAFQRIKGRFSKSGDSLSIIVGSDGKWHVKTTRPVPVGPDWFSFDYGCVLQSEMQNFSGFQSTSSTNFGGIYVNNPDTFILPSSGQAICPWTYLGGDFGKNPPPTFNRTGAEANQPSPGQTDLVRYRQNSEYNIFGGTYCTQIANIPKYTQPLYLSDYNSTVGDLTSPQPLAKVSDAFCYLAEVGGLSGSASPNADEIRVIQGTFNGEAWWMLSKSADRIRIAATCLSYNQL